MTRKKPASSDLLVSVDTSTYSAEVHVGEKIPPKLKKESQRISNFVHQALNATPETPRSTQQPLSSKTPDKTDRSTYGKNWERIFGKKE
jgi:hypothetical protein